MKIVKEKNVIVLVMIAIVKVKIVKNVYLMEGVVQI